MQLVHGEGPASRPPTLTASHPAPGADSRGGTTNDFRLRRRNGESDEVNLKCLNFGKQMVSISICFLCNSLGHKRAVKRNEGHKGYNTLCLPPILRSLFVPEVNAVPFGSDQPPFEKPAKTLEKKLKLQVSTTVAAVPSL